MDKYVYMAIFNPCEEGGYCVTFPDLPECITEGDTVEEAFRMAKEALELFIWNLEDENEEIPIPSKAENIKLENGCFLGVVEACISRN